MNPPTPSDKDWLKETLIDKYMNKRWWVEVANEGKTYSREDWWQFSADEEHYSLKEMYDLVLPLLAQVEREARRDELKALLSQVPMPKLSYEQVENRLAELTTEGEAPKEQKG